MKWIDVKTKKPEGTHFWAWIDTRSSQDIRDAEIRILTHLYGDGEYRDIDDCQIYQLAGEENYGGYYTILAWMPLEEMITPLSKKEKLDKELGEHMIRVIKRNYGIDDNDKSTQSK